MRHLNGKQLMTQLPQLIVVSRRSIQQQSAAIQYRPVDAEPLLDMTQRRAQGRLIRLALGLRLAEPCFLCKIESLQRGRQVVRNGRLLLRQLQRLNHSPDSRSAAAPVDSLLSATASIRTHAADNE